MKRRRPSRCAKVNPRSLAVEILNRVEEKGAYAEPLLDEVLTKTAMGVQDRRLLTHLVYGTIRARGRYDWIIGRLYERGADALDTGIRNVLRVALHQLLTMDRIPDYAVIDEAVETTKAAQNRAGAGLVNALLRRYMREGKG
ncbi:MAG TPA: transcription antitermination factor NusB, partial [Syntrophales bacterium]|nr:transcription antitermination factor NusB [Syntrophales bacterium]